MWTVQMQIMCSAQTLKFIKKQKNKLIAVKNVHIQLVLHRINIWHLCTVKIGPHLCTSILTTMYVQIIWMDICVSISLYCFQLAYVRFDLTAVFMCYICESVGLARGIDWRGRLGITFARWQQPASDIFFFLKRKCLVLFISLFDVSFLKRNPVPFCSEFLQNWDFWY